MMMLWLFPAFLIVGVVVSAVLGTIAGKVERMSEPPTPKNDTGDMTVEDASGKLLGEQKEEYEKKLVKKETELKDLSSHHATLVEKQAAQLNQAQGDLNAANTKCYAVESEKVAMMAMVDSFISEFQDKWVPPVYEEHDFTWAMKQAQEGKKVECGGAVYFIDSISGILKEATNDYCRGLYDVRDALRIDTRPGMRWCVFEEKE